VLLAIEIFADRAGSLHHLIIVASALPILLLVAYVFERFVLSYLFSRFDKIHEYIFILSIGWCLCMVELSHALGMSEEIGAFIAGVTLASLPIAAYIAESLKPLRDFFLVIFFFAIGANFNFANFPIVMIPACTIALLMLFAKPYIFKTLLQRAGEVEKISNEIGIRLGQLSEFSLLVIFLTLEKGLLSNTTGQMIQGAVILTFIASCYWTVKYYPTPLAITDTLRKD
jgi:Kef-type K+ transport system membrane component KefB